MQNEGYFQKLTALFDLLQEKYLKQSPRAPVLQGLSRLIIHMAQREAEAEGMEPTP